jgi:translocation protein SEC63
MPEYDNSAFYYFALSIISFYVVPSWYRIIQNVRAALFTSDHDIGAIARTSAEKSKADNLKQTSRGFKTLSNTGFLVNLGITCLLSAVVVYLSVLVSQNGEIHTFDPFHILGIDRGSELKTIKKAYKKLSLIFHPDKCYKNHPEEFCDDKFLAVNRAYEALTDPIAKENFEKYGNPDGKQSLQVSIGLPTMLLDASNRNIILLTYLIIMVIIVPAAVYKYYSDSSKYGEKNVMYDTYSWYYHSLSEHALMKGLAEVFAGSAEFRERNMPKTSNDREHLTKMMTEVKSQMQ